MTIHSKDFSKATTIPFDSDLQEGAVMTDTLPGKFLTLETTLNTEVLERRVEIRGHCLALVAGATCFTIGSPGIAKTMLPLRLSKYITGGEFFDLPVNSFTQPEEFFGPQSITALKKDRFERMTAQTLVTAQWGVIDEIFKAYKVLTSLHRLLNEGHYKHGTEMIKVPLTTLFCLSNELPRSEELEAVYDRLLLRFSVRPLQHEASVKAMLRAALAEDPAPLLTWAEVEVAQKEALMVTLPDEVLDATVTIWRELREAKVTPSDRRLARAMKLVRAAAWLDGCAAADVEHLGVLEHVLWHHPDQHDEVAVIVNRTAKPLDNEILELLAAVEELERLLSAALAVDVSDVALRMKAANEVEAKARRASEDRKELKQRAGRNQGRHMRLDEVRDRLRPLVETLMAEFYTTAAEAAEIAKNTVEDT